TLGVTGATTLGTLGAGASTLNSATITNNASVGGTLNVTGGTTLAGLNAGASTLGATNAASLTTGTATITGGTINSTVIGGATLQTMLQLVVMLLLQVHLV
ncbi:MAG: hypothetical protein EBU66_11260, partial [Bacteroidetes bacterium]|nr:hypothetical protein [Bacteroidota bacterium]